MRLRVNKAEACRRQADEAIRMLFNGSDPPAVHTVSAAAFQVARDLCKARDDIPQFKQMFRIIRPGMEKLFWKEFNKAASFLKHADIDPHGILDVNEEQSDFMLLFASQLYAALGYELTGEMKIFGAWFAACNPALIKKHSGFDAIHEETAGELEILTTLSEALTSMSRQDRLNSGRIMLASVKS